MLTVCSHGLVPIKEEGTLAAMTYSSLRGAELDGKKAMVRAGFDIPMEKGVITDTSRIEAVVPTIRYILEKGGAAILIAHQDRPKGKVVPKFSQKPLVSVLEKLLGTTVHFADSCIGPDAKKKSDKLKPGEVLLLENLRFDPREEKNDESFAKELASYGDIYVNDAFANSHRKHTSMVALATMMPAYMGLHLEEEVKNLSKVIDDPRRPLTLIVSGAKIETKVPVIENFLQRGDDILVGGAIANTLLAARGFDVAKSLKEEAFYDKAREMMLESKKTETANIHVPRDVVVASEPSDGAQALDLPVENIVGDMAIFDVGRVSVQRYIEIIEKSGSIIWNGPLGMYEVPQFSHASIAIAEAVRRATKDGAITIIGGGDTIDFHTKYGLPLDGYTFVSTGGGAMLDFVSGKELPALRALERGA